MAEFRPNRRRPSKINLMEDFNKLTPEQIFAMGDEANAAFDEKYKSMTTGFVSLMDYQFIDTMINHFVEIEEYEKCGVLKTIKENYGKETKNAK